MAPELLELADIHRSYRNQTRAPTTDADGHEILVGLTRLESEFFVDYQRRDWLARTTHGPSGTTGCRRPAAGPPHVPG